MHDDKITPYVFLTPKDDFFLKRKDLNCFLRTFNIDKLALMMIAMPSLVKTHLEYNSLRLMKLLT